MLRAGEMQFHCRCFSWFLWNKGPVSPAVGHAKIQTSVSAEAILLYLVNLFSNWPPLSLWQHKVRQNQADTENVWGVLSCSVTSDSL